MNFRAEAPIDVDHAVYHDTLPGRSHIAAVEVKHRWRYGVLCFLDSRYRPQHDNTRQTRGRSTKKSTTADEQRWTGIWLSPAGTSVCKRASSRPVSPEHFSVPYRSPMSGQVGLDAVAVHHQGRDIDYAATLSPRVDSEGCKDELFYATDLRAHTQAVEATNFKVTVVWSSSPFNRQAVAVLRWTSSQLNFLAFLEAVYNLFCQRPFLRSVVAPPPYISSLKDYRLLPGHPGTNCLCQGVVSTGRFEYFSFIMLYPSGGY